MEFQSNCNCYRLYLHVIDPMSGMGSVWFPGLSCPRVVLRWGVRVPGEFHDPLGWGVPWEFCDRLGWGVPRELLIPLVLVTARSWLLPSFKMAAASSWSSIMWRGTVSRSSKIVSWGWGGRSHVFHNYMLVPHHPLAFVWFWSDPLFEVISLSAPETPQNNSPFGFCQREGGFRLLWQRSFPSLLNNYLAY